MRKYLLFTALLSCHCLQTFCQNREARKIDSVSLDNLKKVLSSSNGRARIDILNEIATRIEFFVPHSQRKDSINYYASKAYDEATTIGYKPGIAMALLNMSFEAVLAGDPNLDKAPLENKIRRAIQLGKEADDDKVLGYGYYYITCIPSIENSFEKNVDYFNKAIDHFLKAKDTLRAAELTNWLCMDFRSRGEYEKAFDYGKKSVYLSKKTNMRDVSRAWQQDLVHYSLMSMSNLYADAGDHETAMNYIKENARYALEYKTEWNFDADIADLFCQMNKYDSALIYAARLDTLVPKGIFPRRSFIWGQIYLNGTNEYNKAISEFSRCIDTARKYLGNNATAGLLISIGQAYAGRKEYNRALQYANQGMTFAKTSNQRPLMMQGYKTLSLIYRNISRNDSAYEYLLKYQSLKDSIQNKQFLLRIFNSKKAAEEERKTSQINLLNKDNQLKEQKLKQQATLRNSLIAGIILLFLLGVFIFRNLHLKRKNDKLRLQKELEAQQLESAKKQAELHQHAVELEMQALRAQMNPHFIFNCLSSINRFIFKNDNKLASDYLTRFSRLIRMVLMNSSRKLITLEDELEMLRLYLDLERLRFKDAFDYSITTTNIVDAGAIFIPPLLLQPFCENAVWHGLMHKDSKGHLNVIISEVINENDKSLHCIIEDDGIGRDKATEMKSKSAESEKSMGLKITTERLALLNKENNFSTFYKIEDRLNENNEIAGTRVQLKIKYKENVEEFV